MTTQLTDKRTGAKPTATALTDAERIAIVTALREKARRWERVAARASTPDGAALACSAAKKNRDLARRISEPHTVNVALPAAVRGKADVDDWRVRPADGNPGHRSGVWVIEAGDYADEGEPDLHITVETECAQDVAEFIVQAVKEAIR
jgi:hypothetical protein